MSGKRRSDANDLEIERCRKALAERERELTMLKEIAAAVSSQLNLQTVFQLVAERARDLIDAETLLIPVLDPDCEQYTYRAGCGVNSEEIVGESLPIEFGVCGWVWKHRRPWWRGVLHELSEEERNRWEKEAGTLILVPLVGKRHFLGGLAGINKKGGAEFTQRDLGLLTLFASHVAIAIENAVAYDHLQNAVATAERYHAELEAANSKLLEANRELEAHANYDGLTGVPNRWLLQERLNQALAEARENNTPVGLLLIDLDHFKDINDTLGHHIGDLLLQQVCARIEAGADHGLSERGCFSKAGCVSERHGKEAQGRRPGTA